MSDKDFLRTTVEKDLDELEQGYRGLLEQKQQIERAIEQQTGGIHYARMLLEKIDQESGGPDGSTESPVVEGLPEGVEVLAVVEDEGGDPCCDSTECDECPEQEPVTG